MAVRQEWAGVKADLGWTGTKLKGLTAWAACWGTDEDGQLVFMEIWHEGDEALFVGRTRHLGDVGSVAEHFEGMVRRKRAEGYMPVGFEDKRRGAIPSFSGGEGARIAAAGAEGRPAAAAQWGRKLTQGDLERALVGFCQRVGQGWTGTANAKVLLGELRSVQQAVEAFCEAQEGTEACASLRAQLAEAKQAVQKVLMT